MWSLVLAGCTQGNDRKGLGPTPSELLPPSGLHLPKFLQPPKSHPQLEIKSSMHEHVGTFHTEAVMGWVLSTHLVGMWSQ